MRKLLFILIELSMFLFVGCNNVSNKATELINEESNIYEKMNIPTLNVTCGSENILVEKGGYTWSTGNESITVDAASPEQIADKMEGNKVLPESQLTLSFSETPNKVNVVDWSKTQNNTFTFENNKMIVPKEEGTYVYEVIGEWEQGQISFTIKLVVSN